MIQLRTIREQTPYGEVDRLAPQVKLSKTPGRWRAPLVAVRGGDLPVWEDNARVIFGGDRMGAEGYSERRGRLGSAGVGILVLLFALTPSAALAQSVAPAPALPALPVPGSITEPPPDLLDGTLSGLGDELEDDSPKSSWLRFPSPLQPWLDFKQQVLLQQYGFLIGGSEGFLGQDYSNSLTNDHNSVGQKFTLNVGQQLLWRGTPQALWIEMVVEDRGPVGTEFAPLQAGLRTGTSTVTAATWGDFNLGVTQLYLRRAGKCEQPHISACLTFGLTTGAWLRRCVFMRGNTIRRVL